MPLRAKYSTACFVWSLNFAKSSSLLNPLLSINQRKLFSYHAAITFKTRRSSHEFIKFRSHYAISLTREHQVWLSSYLCNHHNNKIYINFDSTPPLSCLQHKNAIHRHVDWMQIIVMLCCCNNNNNLHANKVTLRRRHNNTLLLELCTLCLWYTVT